MGEMRGMRILGESEEREMLEEGGGGEIEEVEGEEVEGKESERLLEGILYCCIHQ